MSVSCKIDVVYPFTKTRKVIYWYQRNNPARQKYKNHLEPDNNGFFSEENREIDEPDLIETFAHNPDFSGLSLSDIFASITLILDKVSREAPRLEQRAFLYRYFTWDISELIFDPKKRQEAEREFAQKGANSWKSIGDKIGVSDHTAKKLCYKFEDRLTRKFCERGLLDPKRLHDDLLNYPDKHIN